MARWEGRRVKALGRKKEATFWARGGGGGGGDRGGGVEGKEGGGHF